MKLRWGHLVDGVAAADDGTISLETIMDFIPLPPSLDGIIVPHLTLALGFQAEQDEGPDHQLIVVVSNPERKLIGAIPHRFTLRGHMPGMGLVGATTVQLREVPLLGIGDYLFHLVVNGKLLTNIPLWVIHQPVTETIEA